MHYEKCNKKVISNFEKGLDKRMKKRQNFTYIHTYGIIMPFFGIYKKTLRYILPDGSLCRMCLFALQ